MPRAPKPAAKAPKAPKAPKGHKLPETFPKGEVLQDVLKKQWKLGPVIGQGGFGLIYLADEAQSSVGNTAPYVVKIEPKDNGPLFCELHFYQRACKQDFLDAWLRGHKLKYLGIPQYIGSGLHTFNGKEYRFMVMQRFSTDLQKLFEASRRFTPKSVLCLGIRMLDCLEYLHEHEYVHADIKAGNILQGYKNGKTENSEVYLVDYGLAFRYIADNKHKEYKEDPKRAHDGTIEFTSRDAHKGVVPSRRGDVEILGYCLLQWLCGRLPWEDRLTDPNYVQDSKIKYMRNIPSLMKACCVDGEAADAVSSYLSNIVKLDYDEKPNYNALRQVLRRGLTKLGTKDEWTLELSGVAITSPKPTAAKGRKRKGNDDIDDSESPPKRKVTTPRVKASAQRKSPAARVKSPAVKAKAGTPKQANTAKKAKGARSPPSAKKTTTRRRKKVVAADASIQTTPSLNRKR
ncbi:serine/threonine-protein kinase VRK1-like [Haliotis rubra]|uniref:serine/threonine-protein kinase VRK1-like n=1 Tax=Haliotis rubra TaxID=36100 RepID=UPI001EE5CA36|nr:serine/threonine-protein kinase VRK1-like [Haliotis rubra]XP_046567139.1 serine/threonine-protein kinase VRK1-like [Haliotis rubra]XP_046567140.1 serine/threonine-protein kinase VRK1-like [Haliotis rubra]XP_046567141.1 serine/threonine-protein kinase VRK1-like [Haliotis rubra]